MKNLLVYSASAGSGKTHNIAKQYILLLFQKPTAWRNILAVTFTNKASEEMKARIIEELHKIANNLPNNRSEEIAELTGKSKQMVINIAQEIFTGILHDYSFFSIFTIDSFFQKILRNFTRETGIQYDYELELDSSKVINIAVDELLEKANSDKKLNELIFNLVYDKMNSEKKWDFRNELKSFLKNVIESDFRTFQTQYDEFFNDPKSLEKLKTELKSIKDNFIKEIENYEKSLKDILKENNLNIKDFSGGESRSIIKRLLKTSEELKSGISIDINKKFANIELIDKWFKVADQEKHSHVFKQCSEISVSMQDCFSENYNYFNSVNIINKNLNHTALINSALNQIKEYLNRESKFLISDVPLFLSEIARNNNASFIYEKTGSFYENFLIDEFQDTSTTQWDSFYPLLSNSLASGNPNIIVGDIKQSIYAWRGGDWNLLASRLKNTFPADFLAKDLSDNWRSGEKIVNFNNIFFEIAVKELANKIKNESSDNLADLLENTIYENIKQNVKKNYKSEVKISIFDKENAKKEEIEENILQNLIFQIEEIQKNGHPANEILILVRGNKEGSQIANYILSYSQTENAKPEIIYDIISSDSLFINSNHAIKFILAFFKFLVNPKDKIAFSEILYSYYKTKYHSNNTGLDLSKVENLDIIEEKINTLYDKLKNKLLYEISDNIIEEFELNKKAENIAFLSSFQNLIHDFEQKQASDLNLFLEYWEESGYKQNIKVPEKQNAINILSIHKAKGLAADFVLIPFCNWNLDMYGKNIWVKSDLPPFNNLPVWSVPYNKELINSAFTIDFYLNQFKNLVEAFNILYVAFTRARKGLYISIIDEKDNSTRKISSILNNTINNENFKKTIEFRQKETPELNCTEYHSGEKPDLITNSTTDDYINDYSISLSEKNIKTKSFFDREKINPESNSSIHKGIAYHKIFENIISKDDIKPAIRRITNIGLIKKNEEDFYFQEIQKILNKPRIKDWFSENYKVLNEAEILSSDGKIYRPDRIIINEEKVIIIDYKFGEQELSKYVYQVTNYAGLLENLGYKTIEIYIWYVLLDFIIKTDPKTGKTEKISVK